MAATIKGITIEIGGNTTKLQDALKDVDKKSKDLQGELKQVDKLLKLDPHNTVLLAQKQELLTQSVANTSEKLKTLKQAQSQANEQFERGEINAGQYRVLTREVEKTTKELENQEKALKQIRAQTGPLVQDFLKFGEGATKLGKKLAPISAGAAGITAGLTALTLTASAAGDRVDKMSQRLGMSRERFQEWDYILSQNGVSMDSMNTAMKSMTASMASLAEGGKKGIDTLKKLGITTSDLKNLQQEDIFEKAVVELQKLPEGYEKARLAQQLFGKQGQEMLPMLNQSKGSIEELKQRAHDLGMIMSNDTVQAAVEFTDALDTGKRVVSAVGAEIGVALVPLLKDLIEKLEGIGAWVKSVDKETVQLIFVITALVAGIAPLLMIIGQISTGIGALLKVIPYLKGGLIEVGAAFKTIFAVMMANPIVLIIAGITALIAALWYLYETNDQVRAAIDGLWESIKVTFTRFMDFLNDIFTKDWSDQFGALGEIMNGAIKKWADLFENAKKIFSSVIEFIKAVFTGDWKAAWTAVKDIFAGVFTLLGDIAKAPLNAIIGYLNAAISGINTLIEGVNAIKFDVPEWVPGIGGKQFGFNVPQIPKIPLLAKGGQLLNGQAIIAEAGPELIQMQGSRAIVTPLTSNAYNSSITGSTTVNIYANVPDYGALESIITRFKGERQSTRQGVIK